MIDWLNWWVLEICCFYLIRDWWPGNILKKIKKTRLLTRMTLKITFKISCPKIFYIYILKYAQFVARKFLKKNGKIKKFHDFSAKKNQNGYSGEVFKYFLINPPTLFWEFLGPCCIQLRKSEIFLNSRFVFLEKCWKIHNSWSGRPWNDCRLK